MPLVTQRKTLEHMFSSIATSICGCHMKANFIPEGNGYSGYTDGVSHTVNVMWDGNAFNGATEEEKVIIRLGILVHECMHICQTDFMYTNEIVSSMNRAEAGIFMEFANTLEDMAIENHASLFCGGMPLKALKYMIGWFYKTNPGLGNEPTAFAQLINALIMFGDMGIVKGEWTFPLAKEYFGKIAMLYDDGVTRANSHERLNIAKECMEICRPLWEDAVKQEEMQKLVEQSLEKLQKLQKSAVSDAQNRNSADSEDFQKTDSKTSRNRKKTISKLASAASNSDTQNNDSNKKSKEKSLLNDKSERAENSKDSDNSSSNSDDKAKSEDTITDIEELMNKNDDNDDISNDIMDISDLLSESSDKNNNSDNKSDDNLTSDRKSEHKSNNESDNKPDNKFNNESDDFERFDEKELENLEKSMEEWIGQQVQTALDESKKESKRQRNQSILVDTNNITGKYTAHNPYNRKVECSSLFATSYKELKTKYSNEIRLLTKQLKTLLEQDREEDIYGSYGRYDVLRGRLGLTADIFKRRKDPGENADIAVMLCIDESGSMKKDYEQARHAAIVFAEALKANKIPFYIMGYTADVGSYDAYHEHFVTWSDRPEELQTLASVKSLGCSFDGYTFKTAAEILSQRSEKNKALFIITDGEPYCQKYGRSNGISDTAKAIEEVKRKISVYAIQIGNRANKDVMKKMYGRDFYHVEGKNISASLGKKLVRAIKKD